MKGAGGRHAILTSKRGEREKKRENAITVVRGKVISSRYRNRKKRRKITGAIKKCLTSLQIYAENYSFPLSEEIRDSEFSYLSLNAEAIAVT